MIDFEGGLEAFGYLKALPQNTRSINAGVTTVSPENYMNVNFYGPYLAIGLSY